jgi:hypothetical protein
MLVTAAHTMLGDNSLVTAGCSNNFACFCLQVRSPFRLRGQSNVLILLRAL